jgi:hypothetical protein
MTPDLAVETAERLQGHYAGFVTRFGGFAIDVIVAAVLFALGGKVVEFLASVVVSADFTISDHRVVAGILLGVWWR